MTLISGSKIQRAQRCPTSFALPQSEKIDDGNERGSAIHKIVQGILEGAENPAWDVEPKHAALAEKMDFSVVRELAEIGAKSEVALAYNVNTGKVRKLSPRFHRDYSSASASEIPLTVDAYALTDDGCIVVDWKTGDGFYSLETITPQLEFYGLCVARLLGEKSVTLSVVQLGSTKTFELRRWTLDESALLGVALSVRRAWEAAISAKPDGVTVEGQHCRYCPAFYSCPAKLAQIKAAATGAAVSADTLEDNPEAMAVAYASATVAERWASDVREVVKVWLQSEGRSIRLPDGRTIGLNSKGALSVR